jgi:hypothetical protein
LAGWLRILGWAAGLGCARSWACHRYPSLTKAALPGCRTCRPTCFLCCCGMLSCRRSSCLWLVCSLAGSYEHCGSDRHSVEAPMGFITSLPVGTRVIAAKNFGPIIKGQLGIVTELAVGRRSFWRRSAYACTFLGGIKVMASRRHIRKHDHACTFQMLEDPLWFLRTCQTPGTVRPSAFDVTRSPYWPIG